MTMCRDDKPSNRVSRVGRTLLLILSAAAFALSASSCTDSASTTVHARSGAGAKRDGGKSPLPKGWLVVDVRMPEDYAERHLAGAILLPHETAAATLTRLVPDRKTPIALYCRSGRRSGLVFEDLKHLGYTRVQDWGSLEELAKIYPTASSPPK